MKRSALFALCGWMAALPIASNAQIVAPNAERVIKAATAELDACLTSIDKDSAYASIAHYSYEKMTLKERVESSTATDAEIALVYQRNDRWEVCRTKYITTFNSVAPTFANIIAQDQIKADQELIRLLKKEATWGEYLTAMHELQLADRTALLNEFQRVQSLEQQSQAVQAAQQQAAAASFSQYQQSQNAIGAALRAFAPTPPAATPLPAPAPGAPLNCRTAVFGTSARTQCY